MFSRYRPSALLKIASFGLSIGIFILIIYIFSFSMITVGSLIFLIIFWWVVIESELLALIIEHFVSIHSKKSDSLKESIWFIDTEKYIQKEMEEHDETTKNNPFMR
jgi:ABC-type bacteriocin/lantibiotic exporter with double-glycine peptidase domain